MHRIAIDRRLVVTAVLLAASAGGFQRTALAQDEEESGLRVPGAFSTESAYGGQSMRLDDRAGTDAPTVEIVTERYANAKPYIERQVTLDTQGNYVNHGTWKMWAADGTAIAEGQYEMGKRVGTWTRWYGRNESRILNAAPFNRFKPPFVSQVNFVNDQMEGQWLIVDADEHQIMQISLSAGKRNGTAITWLPNGKIAQQSSYEHGVPVGDVLELATNPRYTSPIAARNGETAAKAGEQTGDMKVTATYVDGRRIITKTNYHDRVKKIKSSEEMFLAAPAVEQTLDDFWTLTLATYKSEGSDLRHGSSKSWFNTGKSQHEGYYEHDKKSGMFTYWYANGQMYATGEYKNDKPIGPWIWWHQNGLKSAFGEYNDDGYFVGQWRWWGEDGKLTKQKTYDASERITSEKMERETEVGKRTTEDGPTIR